MGPRGVETRASHGCEAEGGVGEIVDTATSTTSKEDRHDHRNSDTLTSPATADGSGLREGYAEIGDVKLHYVEAGDGPLVVLLHGFPEFWYGWRKQIARSSRRASASSRPTCAATTCRRGRMASPTTPPTSWPPTSAGSSSSSAPSPRGHRSRLGRIRRVGPGDEPPRGRRQARHPQRRAPAAAERRAAPPASAPATWYFFYFQFPGLPERRASRRHWRFFKRFLRDARPRYTGMSSIATSRRGPSRGQRRR